MATLELDDVTLRFEREGSGPPVLFIQGVGVCGDGWLPQVEDLRTEFETVRFDNRGIGGSADCRGPIRVEAMARDALALLDQLGWGSAHVVGHSLGGIIAQELALTAPTRVRSLALLCTFSQGREGARLSPRLVWSGVRTRVGTRAMRRQAFLELIFTRAHLESIDRVALADRVGAWIGRDLADSPAILMRQLRALGAHDGYARLGELGHIPTWVLSAEHDPIALPRFGQRLAAAIPGARFELELGASHGVVFHRTRELNAKLRGFLQDSERP
jgi:pimeloyl-ACP methyl ester carboxylesterase